MRGTLAGEKVAEQKLAAFERLQPECEASFRFMHEVHRQRLYWLLSTSVREHGLLSFSARFFLVVRWDSATDPGGKSFSYTRENTRLWAADSQERHAQAACESCKRPLQ